ncbi:hypothetical protein HK097_006136 [Rhizophlyctis rosea]|uniref:Uncharacterized protein n=1 Tax=Rhizophlyctis rosea TaxID=64517 RepID=A0AAD5S1S5_9FUNG|nr:hypothetical protein HK097_006136 [Rhizophlyctis rosea]
MGSGIFGAGAGGGFLSARKVGIRGFQAPGKAHPSAAFAGNSSIFDATDSNGLHSAAWAKGRGKRGRNDWGGERDAGDRNEDEDGGKRTGFKTGSGRRLDPFEERAKEKKAMMEESFGSKFARVAESASFEDTAKSQYALVNIPNHSVSGLKVWTRETRYKKMEEILRKTFDVNDDGLWLWGEVGGVALARCEREKFLDQVALAIEGQAYMVSKTDGEYMRALAGFVKDARSCGSAGGDGGALKKILINVRCGNG